MVYSCVQACARSIAAELCRARSHTSRCVCSWAPDWRRSSRCCRLAACSTALPIPPPCCHTAVRFPGCARPLLCALWPCAVCRLASCQRARNVARDSCRASLRTVEALEGGAPLSLAQGHLPCQPLQLASVRERARRCPAPRPACLCRAGVSGRGRSRECAWQRRYHMRLATLSPLHQGNRKSLVAHMCDAGDACMDRGGCGRMGGSNGRGHPDGRSQQPHVCGPRHGPRPPQRLAPVPSSSLSCAACAGLQSGAS